MLEHGFRYALAGAAALFIAFLLFKLRPSQPRQDELAAELRSARERVHRAKTPADKAEALCDAGAIAARGATTAAAALFLRAMRADPASARVIERAIDALGAPAPRKLEKLLWRRIALIPWDGAHRPAATAAAIGLRDLYRGTPRSRVPYRRPIRDRVRAELMAKLAALLAKGV